MNDPLIAFAGRKRCGKTTLADVYVERYGYVKISFADCLKELVATVVQCTRKKLNEMKDNNDPLPSNVVERSVEVIADRLNVGEDEVSKLLAQHPMKNVRDALQVLGTDVIRVLEPSWHITKTLEKITGLWEKHECVVIDDLRFPNERYAVECIGGKVYYIVRPACHEISNHVSEISLNWTMFSYRNILVNAFPLDVFCKRFAEGDISYAALARFGVYNEPYEEVIKYRNVTPPENLIELMRDEHVDQPTGILLNNFEIIHNPLIIENIKQYV